MTRFDEMDFSQINYIARHDGFTIKEEKNITDSGIIDTKKRDHLCVSCSRRHECYLEEWFVDTEVSDVAKCKYWEKK